MTNMVNQLTLTRVITQKRLQMALQDQISDSDLSDAQEAQGFGGFGGFETQFQGFLRSNPGPTVITSPSNEETRTGRDTISRLFIVDDENNSLSQSVTGNEIDDKEEVKTKNKGCTSAFIRYPDASCIIYDENQCGEKEFVIPLKNGSTFMANGSSISKNIEFVSIRKGCRLQLWKGSTNSILNRLFLQFHQQADVSSNPIL